MGWTSSWIILPDEMRTTPWEWAMWKLFLCGEGTIQFLPNPSVHYSRRTWQQNKIVANTENMNHGTEEAGTFNHHIYCELLKNCRPEGKLILCPSLSFNRLLLNFPFLFFTLGFSWFNWNIMIFSSRSSTSISRSANCCSRRFSNSSWDFCWRAALVNSSSRDRSSWRQDSQK